MRVFYTMTKNKYLLLAFIIVIAIILVNKTLADAALIMALLIYIFMFAKQVERRNEGLDSEKEDDLTASSVTEEDESPKMAEIADPIGDNPQPVMLHGQEFVQHYAYTDAGATGAVGCDSSGRYCGTVYSSHVDIPHGTTVGVDQANVELARRRARDKQALEGQATKDVNYYRYHFAGELNESESKRWWGNNEY